MTGASLFGRAFGRGGRVGGGTDRGATAAGRTRTVCDDGRDSRLRGTRGLDLFGGQRRPRRISKEEREPTRTRRILLDED